MTSGERATFVRDRLPAGGLFAGQDWRISPEPFWLDRRLEGELQRLGRILLQFYRASERLYRRSVEGKSPSWIAELLERGKPERIVRLQRQAAFKSEVPRVIRPDLLLNREGFAITELDSVPGGIGLIGWLNQTYDLLARKNEGFRAAADSGTRGELIGGAAGPIDGFRGIFEGHDRVHLVVSQEAAGYRPEMEWLSAQLPPAGSYGVRNTEFTDFASGDGVYRFFELFDLPQVANADRIFELAADRTVGLTPPPKFLFEEKMLFALFWNRNLRDFWRQELGGGFFRRLQVCIPYSWILDPAPLPPQAAYPELGLTDWRQLKSLSQKERRLILKISGFSPEAWGARGVYLGSDLSADEWGNAVERALQGFETHPYILQRFVKPDVSEVNWYDFSQAVLRPMKGRARLCPYYFVHGTGDRARAILGGCLATVCPADKQIVHGMSEAIMAPCASAASSTTVVPEKARVSVPNSSSIADQ